MLSRMVKEHQERQAVFREQQEKRRKAALAAVQKCTSAMVDSLNSGVEKAYENQRKLDREAKALQVCRVWLWYNLIPRLHSPVQFEVSMMGSGARKRVGFCTGKSELCSGSHALLFRMEHGHHVVSSPDPPHTCRKIGGRVERRPLPPNLFLPDFSAHVWKVSDSKCKRSGIY